MEPRWRARATAWLGRPLGTSLSLVLAAALCAAPAWLLADALGTFVLQGDDFAYLAESRTGPRLIESLGKPHNAHVVPLFRAWTWALATLAGRLQSLPFVIRAASYGVLVLVMLAGGHVVAHEAHDLALGLAAMALLGITTVMQPAAVWYSAGQALWAAFCLLAMLAALQEWTATGAPAWLVAAAAGAIAAPAMWSGGYATGPVGAVYLWLSGRPGARRVAVVPLVATGLFLLGVLVSRGSAVTAPAASLPGLSVASPLWGLSHSCQAVVEALFLGNLGHDAETTAAQGLLLTALLLGLWAWFRRPPGRLNPLEGAGAALVAVTTLMTYTFRGSYPYSSLRGLGWYHAMPHVGFVLFACGWWMRLFPMSNSPRGLRPMTRRGACAVAALALALLILHAPRAERLLAASVGVGVDPSDLTATPPARSRILALARIRAADQRRFLERLDEAERIASQRLIGREAIHQAFGRLTGPGIPPEAADLDALDLLVLPEHAAVTDPRQARAALGSVLAL